MDHPVITDYKAYADIEKSIRIVHLSDLHNNIYGNNNAPVLNSIAKEAPDLILVTGDMLTKNVEDFSIAADFLHRLPPIAPVFLSYGNHEYRYRIRFKDSFEKFTEGLKKCGICILDDETTLVKINGVSLEIGGFTGNGSAYRRLKKTVYFKNIPEPGTKSDFRLLLAHNPELFASYEDTGWDIIFCGHLHGGIVGLPGGRGLVSPSGKLFPKYAHGFFALKNQKKMVVSSGLGTHSINFRLFNPPEIVTLTLGKNTAESEHDQT